MRTIRAAVVAASCMIAMNSVHAQFASLGALASIGASILSGTPAGDVASDVDSFVNKSAALAAIELVADPKARQARYAELYKAESAETQRLLDSGEMERRMRELDSDRKKIIAQALFNFTLGSLQAVELGRDGQALVARAGMNPAELIRIVPVKDAIPLLGRVALDAGGFFVGIARLARGADIAVPDARAGASPADIKV